jgi:hypothetical protein
VRGAIRESEVLASTFRIKAPGNGNRFQQRGLPAAVLPDEERYLGMKFNLLQPLDYREKGYPSNDGTLSRRS